MLNKGFKKILAVALLSTVGLVACSKEVQAKPTNYDEKVISFTDSKDEIYHNLISIIQDAYRDGTLASNVLDKVLYQYSVSVFGRYNKIAKPYNLGEEEITLKDAVASLAGDKKAADNFIEAHKAYWTTDDKGNRLTTDEAKKSEYARIEAKWEAIEKRISRKFYSDVSGGSYSNRGYFSEEKYHAELRNQLHNVKWPATNITKEEDKLVITPELKEEDVFAEIGGKYYFHRENYQDPKANVLGEEEKLEKDTVTYVEDEIIPTIYRSLLVEQYLLDESYNSISRSFARKVNVISISTNSNNDKAANYLMKYFVRNVISGEKQNVEQKDIDAAFKAVSNAVVGVGAEAQTYLDNVNAAYAGAYPKVVPTDPANTYYVGTDFGDVMEKYEKIKDDINTTDSSIESDFTGSYAYTKEIGLQIKKNELLAKDYTTDGWFISKNSVGDLPDSIKTRLFEIGVANVLDNEATDRYATSTYTVPEKESKLVAKINGMHYLKVATKQTGAEDKDDILFYEGGKYYVVQIIEAVSSSKLAKESTKYDADKKEEIINDVARIIAEDDSYKTLSTKHWLEKASLKYHDTKIYDYFKENYPDLFD